MGNYFKNFGKAVKNGDGAVKGSLAVMGLGYFKRKQILKGILTCLVELVWIFLMIFYCAPAIKDFTTLGTHKREAVFDPLTMKNTVIHQGDNSFLILIYGIIAIALIFVFVLFYIHNIKAVYKLQEDEKNGKHINSFKEDLKTLVNDRFHLTLLSLPTLGVILMNILPIMVLIAIAFTNYDSNHMPPGELFSWRGFENFKALFTGTSALAGYSYAFKRILSWTLVWAVFSTLTCFIGGILLAMLINSKGVKLPKLWRVLFIIAIAIPQFVTLLLVKNFFGDQGIVNTICSKIGFTKLMSSLGLIGKNAKYIPFLTSPGWAKFMVIMINIWIGVPYQMLIATGVLMNQPLDQLESAKIDGAGKWKSFWKITMPYILVVQGPALITDFVRNINNFNVIYLLTADSYVTTNQALSNSHGKEVDLLVTWLFRLTGDYQNYKMASVIGIIVFIICVVFTLVSYSFLMRGNKEEDYQL
ncbi:MAG: sugar ABC transporter permease [Lachnospiraceae bacterium]|nr:sugar ABC transporter permease [Lachnospiraceae bacterium]